MTSAETVDLTHAGRPRHVHRDEALPVMVGATVALLPILVPAGPGNTAIADAGIAGCLLVAQHRYSAESGGSYDWVWVLTPNGRQLMKASDDSEDAERQLAEWKRVNVPSDAKTGGARPKSRADCLAN